MDWNPRLRQCERVFKVYDTSNDQSVDITSELEIGQPWPRNGVPDNVVITRLDQRQIEVLFFESGIRLTISMYTSYMNFHAFVPDTFKLKTEGFLGDLDGNPNNEFGTITNERQIYDHLETKCKLDYYQE